MVENNLKLKRLKDCLAVVCDLDGTLYLEDGPVKGAKQFLYRVLDSGRRLFYFTNNNSVSKNSWLKKLNQLGFPVENHQLITSADCADFYLKRHDFYPRIYLLGNKDLQNEFETRGYRCLKEKEALLENPMAVVLGFDTELTYSKLYICYELITRNIPYIATHPDTVCPVTKNSFKPDVGSFIALFETATGGKKPIIVGKPSNEAVQVISEKAHLPAEKIAFIGDRLYTDIRMASLSGMLGILVLSGETTEELLAYSQEKPDIVINSVSDLINYL